MELISSPALHFRRNLRIHSDATESFDDISKVVLSKLSNPRMNVTSFITQYDEKRQVRGWIWPKLAELSSRAARKSLAAGQVIHESLNNATRIWSTPHTEFDSECSQNAALRAASIVARLRSLRSGMDIRELPVRIRIPGFAPILSGVIDGIEWHNGQVVIVETKTTLGKTTHFQDSRIRLAYHQALFYHYMLKRTLVSDYDLVLHGYKKEWENIPLSRNEEKQWMFKGKTVGSVFSLLEEETKKMRELPIADYVIIQVIGPSSSSNYETNPDQCFLLPYDEAIVKDIIKFRLDFFAGRREPLGLLEFYTDKHGGPLVTSNL